MQQLLTQLAPTLDAIAKKLTQDKALQEDLGQEMRMALWEQWQKTPDQTLSWYSQFCAHRAVDYLRRGQSIDSKRRDGVERLSIETEQYEGSRESLPQMVQNECEITYIRRDLLKSIIHRFNDKQRRIIAGLFQGYTERDLGAIEGVSQQAINAQWKHMKKIAKDILRQ